jgi:hypothetical protein
LEVNYECVYTWVYTHLGNPQVRLISARDCLTLTDGLEATRCVSVYLLQSLYVLIQRPPSMDAIAVFPPLWSTPPPSLFATEFEIYMYYTLNIHLHHLLYIILTSVTLVDTHARICEYASNNIIPSCSPLHIFC